MESNTHSFSRFDYGAHVAPVWSVLSRILLWSLAIGAVVGVSIQYYLAILRLLNFRGCDLVVHIRFIEQIDTLVYPLFHYSTLWVSKGLGWDIEYSGVIVTLGACLVAGVLLHQVLRVYLRDILPLPTTIILAVSLLEIAGCWLPSFHAPLTVGVGTPNWIHNPTLIMSKPFTFAFILLFYGVIQARSERRALILSVVSCLVAVCSAMAKPNFALAFIFAAPAVCLLLMIMGRLRFVRLVCLMLPVLAFVGTLFWQQKSYTQDGGIYLAFAPMEIARTFHAYPWVGIVQGLAFPLGVVVCYPRILKCPLFLVCLASYLVALGHYLLFTETGIRKVFGNIGWGTQVMLPLLFAVTLGYFIQQVVTHKGRGGIVVPLTLLALYGWHLWSGAEFFIARFNSDMPF